MKLIRDIKALTDMSEDVDTTLTDQQKIATRKLICSRYADDNRPVEELAADAAEFMMMLGVHPSQKYELEPDYISIRRLRAAGIQ